MNLRLVRLLKLHGLYCAPAGEDGADLGSGEDAGQTELDMNNDAGEGAEGGEEQGDGEGADGADGGETAAEDAEVIVSLGEDQQQEEEDPTRAPEWLRDLRKSNREKDRRIRELESQVAAATPAPAAVVVGEKPKLEDFDYEPEKFAAALDAWHVRKAQADEQQKKREDTQNRERAQWTSRLDAVTKAAEGLKVPDLEDATAAFESAFSMVQQGIVLGGPEDAKTSAMLKYALGKNPAKARELAAIQDPVKFAVALGKLEMQLKVTPRKVAPAPDKKVSSAVSGAAAVDNQIERLREDARRTGDYSKVAEYRRQQDKKAAAAK